MRQKSHTLAEKVKQHVRFRELGRRNYTKADELLEQLLLEMEPGETVKISKHRTAMLVNNFANRNTAFRQHGIKLYEFVVSDG